MKIGLIVLGTAWLVLAYPGPFNVVADVVVTRLEPPFPVLVPWEDLPDPLVEPFDFNHDGQVDVNFTYDNVGMDADFFSPAQVFIVRTSPPPGNTNVYGAVAALPFGTVIGSNVVSSINLSNYVWYHGDIIPDDGGYPYGDHGNTVGYVVSDVTEGDPFAVVGDVVGKEGAMAFEFFINGQPHFGYIHFDFRYIYSIDPLGGFGGYIDGYAYETQPGAPIVAERLGDSTPTNNDVLITSFRPIDGFSLTWAAVNGVIYQVQSSTNLLNWVPASPQIPANGNSLNITIPFFQRPQMFYRILRVN